MTDRNATPANLDEVRLLVDGMEFTGWSTIRIIRQLESASGSFRVEGAHRIPWPLLPGAPVEVVIANREREDTILSGFIDDLNATGRTDRRSVTIAGRDKTADLVDCSEITEPGEWTGLTLRELAIEILRPFDIDLRTELTAQGEPFPTFKIQTGEKAWNALERACRMRATLAFAEGDGALVLAKPASRFSNVALVEGENITEWTVNLSRRQRFQTYIVRGQGRGSNAGWGEAVAQVEGRATDPQVTRYRPLIVLSEGTATFDSARDRAQWEAAFRAARAHTIDIELPNWRQGGPETDLWAINTELPVVIPSEQIDAQFLTREVAFTRTAKEGNKCTINLTRPDAYTPKPEVEMGEDPFDELFDQTLVEGLTTDEGGL